MIRMTTFDSFSEWLSRRQSRIGGSDAAAVIGLNPYKSNLRLWQEKTGKVQAEDISDKPYVKYGTDAEAHLRELFKMDFPEYQVLYEAGNMWTNDMYPFAHASLDGWLVDSEGRNGVLEIKTTNIMRAGQSDLWKGRIPDNYYIQLLHYLMVTGFEFAILKGQLKYEFGEMWLLTKHFKIERSEVQADINFLIDKEREFWQHIEDNTPPALILSDI